MKLNKFKVIPSSIGVIIGAVALAFFDYPNQPLIAFGMILIVIALGITKQVDWL